MLRGNDTTIDFVENPVVLRAYFLGLPVDGRVSYKSDVERLPRVGVLTVSRTSAAEEARRQGRDVEPTPLRVLLIEDDPADALLIVQELERTGYDVTWHRVQTAPDLEMALRRQWDVITCDWVMPAFGAPAALNVLRKHDSDVPVIIVSGQAAEGVTVTAMKAGAHDVVSKHKLTRLGPAVERELRETKVRRARRQAEAALKASEARYRRLFETARDGIFILETAAGRIIDVNPYLVELLGYTRDQMLGKQLWELGPFRDIAASRDMFRDLQTKSYVRYDHLPLESSDGQRRDVEFVSNAYQANGTRVIQCNVRDITERKRTERVIAALNVDLERRVSARTAQVGMINEELEAFSYSVSHDLRAPLRHVEQFGKLLLEDHAAQLDGQGRHYVERIQAATRRMDNLITDLLRLSRVALVEMAPQKVNVSALVEAIVADLRESDPTRRVEWVIAPAVVAEGDPSLLRVALDNLLTNSWKYTSKHSSARIEFGTFESEGGVVYFVRDDGAGFDMTRSEKLFGAFQRLHGEAEFPGSGIGLATVQRIVRRHGGRVWAEAAVERGATIYFTLGPAGPVPEPGQPPA